MPAQPAVFYRNLLDPIATLLEASSSAIGAPVLYLLDQLISKVWRTPIGWVITANNNKIDFDRGGVKVATVAVGTYTTGAALATAVVTALEAADSTPVWACVYDPTTHKFTISSDMAFTLLFDTGTDFAKQIQKCMGYPKTDTSSATSHTAPLVSYQSRHVINIDLGASTAATACAVAGHNLSVPDIGVRLQTNGTPMTSFGYDSIIGTGHLNQTILGDRVRASLFATQTRRYWRLLIEDVQNPDGYAEVGVLHLSMHDLLARVLAEPTDEREELSQLTYALEGAHYQLRRPTRRGWEFEFAITDTEKTAVWEPWATAVRAGGNFFFALDSTVIATWRYVYMDQGMSWYALRTSEPLRWRVKLLLLEVLG